MSQVTLQGKPVEVAGDLPEEGKKAPPFRLVNGDLKDVTLADFPGKRKVLNIVPSLDTSVCAESTRKFNKNAGEVGNTVVLIVSADLPFASKRFCTVEGLKNVVPLSTMEPAYMIATSSAIWATTPKSCVIRSIDVPRSRRRASNSARICACTVTSRADVGSSAITTFGLSAVAIAIMTRWHIPPERWNGYCPATRSGSGRPTCRRSSMAR